MPRVRRTSWRGSRKRQSKKAGRTPTIRRRAGFAVTNNRRNTARQFKGRSGENIQVGPSDDSKSAIVDPVTNDNNNNNDNDDNAQTTISLATTRAALAAIDTISKELSPNPDDQLALVTNKLNVLDLVREATVNFQSTDNDTVAVNQLVRLLGPIKNNAALINAIEGCFNTEDASPSSKNCVALLQTAIDQQEDDLVTQTVWNHLIPAVDAASQLLGSDVGDRRARVFLDKIAQTFTPLSLSSLIQQNNNNTNTDQATVITYDQLSAYLNNDVDVASTEAEEWNTVVTNELLPAVAIFYDYALTHSAIRKQVLRQLELRSGQVALIEKAASAIDQINEARAKDENATAARVRYDNGSRAANMLSTAAIDALRKSEDEWEQLDLEFMNAYDSAMDAYQMARRAYGPRSSAASGYGYDAEEKEEEDNGDYILSLPQIYVDVANPDDPNAASVANQLAEALGAVDLVLNKIATLKSQHTTVNAVRKLESGVNRALLGHEPAGASDLAAVSSYWNDAMAPVFSNGNCPAPREAKRAAIAGALAPLRHDTFGNNSSESLGQFKAKLTEFFDAVNSAEKCIAAWNEIKQAEKTRREQRRWL